MDSKHYNPNALKELRRVRGETQDQLARALNVHRQTIYRAETGKDIPYELLCALASHFGVEVTSLLYPRPIQEPKLVTTQALA